MNTIFVAQIDEPEFRDLAPTVTALADHESFPAHANAIRIRL
ncbi:MAG: histidinol dehydrogenase [Propionibacteriaceae bacterium]|nr:histidinol dehydrogenase [Propionibacteriaceae bacterium]